MMRTLKQDDTLPQLPKKGFGWTIKYQRRVCHVNSWLSEFIKQSTEGMAEVRAEQQQPAGRSVVAWEADPSCTEGVPPPPLICWHCCYHLILPQRSVKAAGINA